MKTTAYFGNSVLAKRPYLSAEICVAVIANHIRSEVQPNGRIRFWGEVALPGYSAPRIVRVVTLADGETIHNGFIDSGFWRRAN